MKKLLGIYLSLWLVIAAVGAEKPTGQTIKLDKQPDSGKPALGISFTLSRAKDEDGKSDGDPDRDSWSILLTRIGSFPEGTTWNLYRGDTSAYALERWKPLILPGVLFQARLTGSEAARVLAHQADLTLVFKLPSGVTELLPIGKFCRDDAMKTHFKNSTNHKRCFEVDASDVTGESSAAIDSDASWPRNADDRRTGTH